MNRVIFQYTTPSWAGPGMPEKTRGPSHGPGGRRHRRSIIIVHQLSWAVARPGP